MKRPKSAGFTLLEVVIAMAILSSALVGLYMTTGRAIRISMHAKAMTQATFFVPSKKWPRFTMSSSLRALRTTPDRRKIAASFRNRRFKQFSLRDDHRKDSDACDGSDAVGGDQAVCKIGRAQRARTSQRLPRRRRVATWRAGCRGLLGPVKDMLEQGIRRVTVRVLWDEPGLPEQQVEVVGFFTDVRKAPVSL
jgi:prepilin-type N-terminal cleavage/methylation domain-containing protein